MLRDLKTTQRNARLLAFKVTGTGTAAINVGATDATLTDNGTGDYTLTYRKAFARALPIPVVTPLTTGIHCEVTVSNATTLQIKTFLVADGTTATDAVFFVHVMGFDSADET